MDQQVSPRKPLRIALAGSAIDPFSVGHLALLLALMSMDFDIIYWVAAGVRKGKIPNVTPDERVKMTILGIPKRLLSKVRPKLNVVFADAYGRNTPSITWLRRLHRRHPGAEIVLATGADSVTDGPDDIRHWVRGDLIYANWNVLVFPRVGFATVRQLRRILRARPNFMVADKALPDVACRDIRERIGSKKRWTHLVPPAVALFIKQNHLYQNG